MGRKEAGPGVTLAEACAMLATSAELEVNPRPGASVRTVPVAKTCVPITLFVVNRSLGE